MKQMILTGLATEQNFDRSGEAQFFLVFNGGELRVPCTEAAAQTVVKAMYGGSNGQSEEFEEDEGGEEEWTPKADGPSYDEDGVEQA